MTEWQVYILDSDKLRRQVKVYIGRYVDGRDEFLTPDGRVVQEKPDVVPTEDTSWNLPVPTLIPLHKALSDHLGTGIPSVGELKVLREWLVAERERVDKLIDRP